MAAQGIPTVQAYGLSALFTVLVFSVRLVRRAVQGVNGALHLLGVGAGAQEAPREPPQLERMARPTWSTSSSLVVVCLAALMAKHLEKHAGSSRNGCMRI